MKFHPLASVFPLLEGEDFETLTESIRANGLREAIVLHPDGSVLDGRNRLRACLKAGVEPRFRTYDGDDALGFVIDLNLNRRQLTLSQRAMVAAEIATLAQGARTDLSEISEMSQPKAAKLLGVSVDSIGFGRRVLESGDAELIDLVKTGKIAVSLAAKLAEDAPELRQSALAKIRAGERPAMAVKMTRQEEGFEARGDEVDRLPPCEAGDDIEALLEGDANGERKWSCASRLLAGSRSKPPTTARAASKYPGGIPIFIPRVAKRLRAVPFRQLGDRRRVVALD